MVAELAQIAGIPLGVIRLIGAEIVFGSDNDGNSRGRVWLPLQASNHLIYGKNGVGKSTIVNLLRCALTGEEPLDDARIDLFIELDENAPLPIREHAQEFVVIDGLDSDGEESSRIPLSIDSDHDENENEKETEWGESEEDDASDLGLLADGSGDDEQSETYDAEDHLFLDTEELVKAISECSFFQQHCPAIGMEFDAFDAIQRLFADNDQGIDMEQFVSRSWNDLSGVSLRQARNTWLAYCYLEDKNSDFGHNEKTLSIVARAYREAAAQSYYCLTPVGKSEAPEWELTVACKASHATSGLKDLYSLFEACREAAETDELADLDSELDPRALLPSMALTDWEYPTENQFLEPSTEHPYRKLRPYMERTPRVKADFLHWDDLLEVLNLSDFFDYSKWRLETSKALFPADSDEGSWTVIFSNGPDGVEDSIESSKLDELKKLIQQVAEAVSKMDINVLDIRIQTSTDFTKWISGQGIELQAQDATTRSWVDFIELSSAQQHIISSVLRLIQPKTARDSNSPPFRIVLGDEPDRNMHQIAIRHFYEFLDRKETCSYLSTHSSVALSLPSFSRLHAYRKPSGNIRLVPWTPIFLAKSEGFDLGVDKTALLSAVSLVILVEGAHDEEAIKLLLTQTDSQVYNRVLVLPWRGHRTMNTIADSYVWMNMTDARILVVVDNSRAQIINKWCEIIKKSFTEGRPLAKITRELRESSGLSGEEKTLRDLLERSIQIGVADRVFAFGFSRGDIIEYADPADFGLKKSWQDLRRDYQRSTNRTSFKDWLRSEHAARISTKAVTAAFANLDHLDDDLVNLLKLIKDIG
ncbi:MAG: hypothetical protein FJ147_28100 [Deltaproteobacteria bacterium]|nr:hypothetical protein [Deltaproteobacteria bacterium]